MLKKNTSCSYEKDKKTCFEGHRIMTSWTLSMLGVRKLQLNKMEYDTWYAK
jgi:hypothetical protein